jgi:hypothetical protein
LRVNNVLIPVTAAADMVGLRLRALDGAAPDGRSAP